MRRGLLYLVVSSIIIGSYPAINKILLLRGFQTNEMLFYSALFSLLSSLVFMAISHKKFQANIKQIVVAMITGAMGNALTGTLLIGSYNYISTSVGLMLNFMYPTIVVIVMIVAFKEKATAKKIAAVVVSVLGFALIADLNSGLNIKGLLLGLGSAVTYSFYIISNDKFCIKDLDVSERLVYIYFGSMLLKVPYAGLIKETWNDPLGNVLMMAIGVILFVAFMLFLTGEHIVGATKTSFCNMIEPITNIVVSRVVFSDVLTTRMVIGCILIIVSILIEALDGISKKNKKEKNL